MQSFRTRMNSVLRRSSISGKSDLSGSESDAPSRKSSGDKDTKRFNKKRVSFGARVRGNTGDTLEHSQLAKQVVDAINADKPSLTDDKPIVAIASLPLDSSTQHTKTDSPVDTGELSRDGTSLQEPSEPAAVDDNAHEAIEQAHVEVEQLTFPVESRPAPAETVLPAQVEEAVVPVVVAAPVEYHHDAEQAATDMWASSQEQHADHVPPEIGNIMYVSALRCGIILIQLQCQRFGGSI